MDQREEFVRLAQSEARNMRALCERYGVSPTTGYTWLARYEAEGRAPCLTVLPNPTIQTPG